jgi:hypothetical protein
MDDYSMSSLQESRNEWCSRLISILTPLVIQGIKSIFDESYNLCIENDEEEKYLMTFQNFLSRVPKWNGTLIDTETKRILDKSSCGYLEDLITCVHIIQLKSLTCMRVSNSNKKVNLKIPELKDFVHKIYINVARKIYTNVYLFEKDILPLNIQKNNRELEIITRECIISTIRENIPVEEILKVYLDESIEEDVQIEEKEEIVSEKPILEPEESNIDKNAVQFSDIDTAISENNKETEIVAPKTLERLEKISNDNLIKRKEEEEEEVEEKIKIGDNIDLNELDVHPVVPAPKQLAEEDVWNEIEILPLE